MLAVEQTNGKVQRSEKMGWHTDVRKEINECNFEMRKSVFMFSRRFTQQGPCSNT